MRAEEVIWMIQLIALTSLIFTSITGIDTIKSILISIIVVGFLVTA